MKKNSRLLDASIYRYSFDVQSRFSDIDLQQHLNNTRIGEYYQEGRVRFFNHMIRENNIPRPEGLTFLVAHIAIDYLAEINYPEVATMKLAIANVGRTSIALQMALFNEARCAGLAKVVVVIANAQGPTPIPDDWRAALNRYALAPDVLES